MIRHQLQLKRCVKSCSNLDMLQALKRMKEQLQRLSPMNHEINLIKKMISYATALNIQKMTSNKILSITVNL